MDVIGRTNLNRRWAINISSMYSAKDFPRSVHLCHCKDILSFCEQLLNLLSANSSVYTHLDKTCSKKGILNDLKST